MTDKIRNLLEDVQTVYEGKGMVVHPNSFDKLRMEVIKLDNINILQGAQIEKMKKYGKLLQDICVVLGNDSHMVAVQLEIVVEKLWDASEEKEGLKIVEDIKNRLLEIKPQEWAEINEWEIKK